jgi:hypothetical protein
VIKVLNLLIFELIEKQMIVYVCLEEWSSVVRALCSSWTVLKQAQKQIKMT